MTTALGILSNIELETLIRVARAARDEIQVRKFELQERELTIGDGHVREAILACENQAFVLTQTVAKLWILLNERSSHVPLGTKPKPPHVP